MYLELVLLVFEVTDGRGLISAPGMGIVICESRQWIKFIECSRSFLIHCQGHRILINTCFIRKKVVLPKDISVTRIKCSNLETIVCTMCCSGCGTISSK